MALIQRARNFARHGKHFHTLGKCLSDNPVLQRRCLMSTYTDYEISTEEFKHVERILPNELIPDPPKHESYPTPSGWVPPKDSAKTLPYIVRRTRNHNLPVYFEQRNTRKLTQVKGILGDIWAFEADLRTHLEKKAGKKLCSQVHEVARFVRIKGSFTEETSEFLVQKGF